MHAENSNAAPRGNRGRGGRWKHAPKGDGGEEEDVCVVVSEDGKRYRLSACSVIFNAQGLFLGLRRVRQSFYQNVQGGVRNGETPLQGAAREIEEEIGISTDFLTCVRSSVEPESTNQSASKRVTNTRAVFRYSSQSWKHLQIVGQELYPLLFYADASITQHINFIPKDRSVKQEFDRWEWLTANEMLRRMPPSKLLVMYNVFRAVVRDVNAFLLENHFIGDADQLTMFSLEAAREANTAHKAVAQEQLSRKQNQRRENPPAQHKSVEKPRPVEHTQKQTNTNESGAIDSASGARKRAGNVKQCRFYGTSDGCWKGDACPFQHTQPSNPPVVALEHQNHHD